MSRWQRKPWTAKRLGLTALAAAGVLTLVGLLIAQDQETLHIRSAVAAEEPGAFTYMAGLVGGGMAGGSTYDVFDNGDEIFPAMLAAIASARRRISFETYVYDKGEVADAFTTALLDAAGRGVHVNLVLDAVGSGSVDAALLDRFIAAGCHAFMFNRTHWYRLEELNYRTHRKILVVDGDTAFTGGVGVADHWLGHAQDEDHWRDMMVRIRGPVARLLEGAFYENFIEAGGVVTPQFDGVAVNAGDKPDSLVVRGAPSGGSNDLKRFYLLSLALARRTIDIQSPYFVVDESTLWALQDAVGRGVAIRVLMEGEFTDARPVKYASRGSYDTLLSLGIELHEYLPTMMHVKALVIDGVWSVFGSANFDNRSLELNDELNVAVMNRALAERLTRGFERDLQSARRLTLESWRARPMFDRTREQFWSFFGEIF